MVEGTGKRRTSPLPPLLVGMPEGGNGSLRVAILIPHGGTSLVVNAGMVHGDSQYVSVHSSSDTYGGRQLADSPDSARAPPRPRYEVPPRRWLHSPSSHRLLFHSLCGFPSSLRHVALVTNTAAHACAPSPFTYPVERVHCPAHCTARSFVWRIASTTSHRVVRLTAVRKYQTQTNVNRIPYPSS